MEQEKKTAITKQKILSAAEREFSQNGPAAARVDAIAKAAGVNKQLIYAHFGSKEGLYKTVLAIVYSRLGEYERVLENSEFESIETIREIIMEYFDFLIKNPSFVRLVMWENLSSASHVGDISANLFRGAEKLLCRGRELGMIRADIDIRQTALSLNIFCFSAFSNIHTVSRLMGRDMTAVDEIKKRAEHIADVLMCYAKA